MRVFANDSAPKEFADLLRYCAKHRRPYRLVPDAELEKVAGARHHEGICMVVRRRRAATLDQALARDVGGPILALSGVDNPHNVGALLRSAAHFGVRAVLLAGERSQLSAAATRTAEGGAEWLDAIFTGDLAGDLARCRAAGFTVLATSSHADASLYEQALPAKAVILVGSERHGLPRQLRHRANRTLAIPGTGHVESLNVATAATLLLAEHWRQHR